MLSTPWKSTVYVFKTKNQVSFTLDLERSDQLASSSGWRGAPPVFFRKVEPRKGGLQEDELGVKVLRTMGFPTTGLR